MPNNLQELTFLPTAARLANALEMLDEVHSAIAEDRMDVVNHAGKAELRAWLREIAYIANEAATELEAQAPAVSFRVIQGGKAGGQPIQGETPDGPRQREEKPVAPDFRVLVGTGYPSQEVRQKAGS